MSKNKKKILSFIKIIIYIIFVIAVIIFIKKNNISDINEIKNIILKQKKIAPIVYILLFSLLPTFFVSVTVLAISSGFIFGLLYGSIFTFIGTLINATLTYFISKFIAYDFINDLIENKYNNIYIKLKTIKNTKSGFIFMAMLRLMPFIPYTLLNYIYGIVDIGYFLFITSTMIGILPGMIIYVNIGTHLDNIGSNNFLLSIIIFIIFASITTIIAKILYKNKN